MQFYLAPMESITGYVYRNVYHSLWDDVDKYFAPFITPTQKKILKTRERKDVAPENNQDMYMVPQILTNQSEQFIDTCIFLSQNGYREVNLNLGCPATTVVTKGKGSGFLLDKEKLQQFFEDVFSWNESLSKQEQFSISVKTRLGLEASEEFDDILKIYNQYPLKEVIIHPRVRNDFYNGKPDLIAFEKALENCQHPVCYNGDIFTTEGYERLIEKFPTIDKIMIGRGIIGNPGLIREIRTGKKVKAEELWKYHDALYEGYKQDIEAEKDVLFKMKELWFYLGRNFQNSEKMVSKIRKTKKPEEYRAMIHIAKETLSI